MLKASAIGAARGPSRTASPSRGALEYGTPESEMASAKAVGSLGIVSPWAAVAR